MNDTAARVSGIEGTQYGPWNPGIASELPPQLVALSTIFRPEHVFTTVEHARELRDLTGLGVEELVVFRPERLVVHEVLMRVTGDLSVPDGSAVDDLGVNFRRMTHRLLAQHLAPRMSEIVAVYEDLKGRLSTLIEGELAALFRPAPTPADKPTGRFDLKRWFRGNQQIRPRIEDDREREERILREWTAKARSGADPLAHAAYDALVKVVSAVRTKYGRLWGDAKLLAPIATGIACNQHGAEVIGQLVEPWFRQAAEVEGYRLLPVQERPVVLNTKGSSASGKSTMRPFQKKLVGEIGVDWSEFALISPDIWRQYLLDYHSLGEHHKYAGMFTGRELAIIDRKLDRYMSRKGEREGISHLLIDRFRFDSFAPDVDEANTTAMTRFGHLVYLFFMITPPHATVERAWQRGLRVGRYKAVDDLLGHNIEAFTGMPNLFFTWALRTKRRVHFEFLDNSVAFGERPRTIAFGWNGEMNVLNVKCMLDIDRYRKINVNAKSPKDVYPDAKTMAPENNTQFLERCARTLVSVNFADRNTGLVYARLEAGQLTWTDPEALARAMEDADTRAGILAVAPGALTFSRKSGADTPPQQEAMQAERLHSLGDWGRQQ